MSVHLSANLLICQWIRHLRRHMKASMLSGLLQLWGWVRKINKHILFLNIGGLSQILPPRKENCTKFQLFSLVSLDQHFSFQIHTDLWTCPLNYILTPSLPLFFSFSFLKLIKTSPTARMLPWKSRHPWTVLREETRYGFHLSTKLCCSVRFNLVIHSIIMMGNVYILVWEYRGDCKVTQRPLRERKRRMKTSLWASPGPTPSGSRSPTSSSCPSSFRCGSRCLTSGERWWYAHIALTTHFLQLSGTWENFGIT